MMSRSGEGSGSAITKRDIVDDLDLDLPLPRDGALLGDDPVDPFDDKEDGTDPTDPFFFIGSYINSPESREGVYKREVDDGSNVLDCLCFPFFFFFDFDRMVLALDNAEFCFPFFLVRRALVLLLAARALVGRLWERVILWDPGRCLGLPE